MCKSALILFLMLQEVMSKFLLENDRTWNENDNRMHCVEYCTNSCLNNCSPQPEFCDIIWAMETENSNNEQNSNNGAPQSCAPTGCECKPCNRLKTKIIN